METEFAPNADHSGTVEGKTMQELPETGYLRLKQVLTLIPVSRSTWWAGVKSGRYPSPTYSLGDRITAWRVEDIKALLKQSAVSPRATSKKRLDMATLPQSSSPTAAPSPLPADRSKAQIPRELGAPTVAKINVRFVNEWVNFLSRYRWTLFLTLTFGRNRRAVRVGQSPEFAEKAFRRLIRHVNEHIYGPRWMAKSPNGGVVWARVHELQRDGTSHYHAVIFSPDVSNMPLLISEMNAWWRAKYGAAVIEMPTCELNVLNYLLKSSSDPNSSEVDVSFNLGRSG
jgi:predicted DNA-binding transcriptional regulator AlpA